MRILNVLKQDEKLLLTLLKELPINEIIARLLINRGVTAPADAEVFLDAGLDKLCDPFLMPEMGKAVELVRRAASEKRKVMIFGDYDVDGVTAVSLLKERLRAMGMEVYSSLPHRIKEGYGLNANAVKEAVEKRAGLFITADCGINSCGEVAELRKNGIEVIVTDHHEPGEEQVSCASALLNPKVKGCGYPFRELAGVGVAYKLCQALARDRLEKDLDLVCLGTIADVVPLNGENRILVRHGLKRLSSTGRSGLKALMRVSGLSGKQLTSHSVGFILGPRINASGRMASADISLDLLSCEDEIQADSLAREIESFNRNRQRVESCIMEEAQALIDSEVNFKEQNVIVVAKEGWHHGVLGIVAAKLTDRFNRPTILISMGDKFCKGSGRSIRSFHLFNALCECGDFLDDFGGHSHAAGLVISRDNILDFRRKINDFARASLSIEDLMPTIDVDMQLPLSAATAELCAGLRAMEPFGAGNPEPLFLIRELSLKGSPRLLRKDTLKFWATDGSRTLPAIGFGMGSLLAGLESCDTFDLVCRPQIDEWYGDDSVILHVKEIIFC
ncbi:MAG: single-stranded-DNA-specific exonuclease RecJ [Syntrophales bacterium]|nr:single-stranded-DNA-specific exonuclease RecJ [Syntrophales bacterium]